ncbi:Putative amidase domain-containing protein [Anaerovirgula multivorans]|uniref:Putative amidase domain-containing protein n=1 Tax=Anaerovirgula multivorans TaxID=312168 RepID=A0A239D5L6_9FIRM|nr:amidase domain-containing protein [Anaerovirgula multivorans]SNS27650.1 Putative amidase domain-containing protein [Anaerovirgula multivorans]
MIIIIRFKKIIILLLVTIFIVICGLGIHLWNLSSKTSAVFLDENINKMLALKIEEIFEIRNTALLKGDRATLESLYNIQVRNGLWAYEHELKKMKYLHNWSAKQSIKITKIDSQIIVRNASKKQDGFSLNLLVSTEYQYVYEDTSNVDNSFRIGTYHSLDLMPYGEGWGITREWYTDPFADSLHLDEIESQDVQQIILSGEPKNLSDLNERRVKAVDYTDQYCGAAGLPEYGFKYNSKYRDYNPQGGDCANFASQMLYEGGGFRKNGTWNYERGAGSKAWVNARAFHNYMVYSGRGSVMTHGSYEKVLESSYRLLPGDYIAYEKKGKVTHISVVTGMDSKGYILVNSHNSDRYRVPWDLGWSDNGIKFSLVRVHY